MKFFKDTNNNPYAYEDNDKNIKEGLTPIIKDELKELLKPSEEELTTQHNEDIKAQIDNLEKQLVRPYRELLSSITTDIVKAEAQKKIDDIELQIQNKRAEFQ